MSAFDGFLSPWNPLLGNQLVLHWGDRWCINCFNFHLFHDGLWIMTSMYIRDEYKDLTSLLSLPMLVMCSCSKACTYLWPIHLPSWTCIPAEPPWLTFRESFHIDHAASLPYVLSKTNFRGRIFMTHSTKAIYKWLIQDSVRVGYERDP